MRLARTGFDHMTRSLLPRTAAVARVTRGQHTPFIGVSGAMLEGPQDDDFDLAALLDMDLDQPSGSRQPLARSSSECSDDNDFPAGKDSDADLVSEILGVNGDYGESAMLTRSLPEQPEQRGSKPGQHRHRLGRASSRRAASDKQLDLDALLDDIGFGQHDDPQPRLFQVPDEDIDEAMAQEPAYRFIKNMEPRLRQRLNTGHVLRVPYASDCSGADAPAIAWQSVARVLRHLQICEVEFVHEFASEHPKHYAAQSYALRRLFSDLHARTADQGPTLHSAPDVEVLGHEESGSPLVGLPPQGHLLFYVTGFECQDMSTANRSPVDLVLTLDEDQDYQDLGRSSSTLRDSLKTVAALKPRVVMIENVAACPTEAILDHCCQHLSDWDWKGFRGDSVDWGIRHMPLHNVGYRHFT